LFAISGQAHRELRVEFRLWLGRNDVDETARNVLAKQSSLRTAQQLNAFNIDRAHIAAQRGRNIVAIDIHTGTKDEYRIRKTAADATNDNARIVGTVIARQRDVRHKFTGLVNAVNALYLHLLVSDSRD
jgi:hypothetical protein